MSGYVYKGAGHPRGLFDSPEIRAKVERAKTLFEEGVPVVSTNDGLDFYATKARTRPAAEEPDDETPPDEPTIA
ncbi:MAG: hypothetical protein ACK4TJ_05835 [Tabrizicola sp.]